MGAAAATTLAGCDSGSSGDAGGCTLSVPTLVLCTWTLLCMLYSWKIDLEGLDHICSTARFFIGATTDRGELRSTECLMGQLLADVRRSGPPLMPKMCWEGAWIYDRHTSSLCDTHVMHGQRCWLSFALLMGMYTFSKP